MPAKKSYLSIRFKYKKVTLCLLLDPKATVKSVKDTVAEALNETHVLEDSDGDDIAIPTIGEDGTVDADAEDTNRAASEETSAEISGGSLRFAKEESKGVWEEFSTGTLESNKIAENSVVAFAIGSDEFEVDYPLAELEEA